MFEKRLTVPLFDFKLKELSPLRNNPFSELKVNMDDTSCEKKAISEEESEEEEMEEENKKEVKKKIVKVIGVKSEEEEDKIEVKKKIVKVIGVKYEEEEKESSDSDEDEEDSDTGDMSMSSYEKMIEKKRAERMAFLKSLQIDEEEEKESSDSDEDDEDSDTGNMSMSSYEKMIEKKRAERMAFLKSLQMDEVKADFHEAITTIKKKKQPHKRKYKKPEARSPPPVRKSRRIANLGVSIDLSEDALFQKAINDAKIPPELSYETALQFERSYEDYCKNFDFETPHTEFKPFSYDKSVVNNLTLPESNIAKVMPDRIIAAAWHPAPENLIFACGDIHGNLGIWKVDSESVPFVFKIHNQSTTNVMFNPFNSNHLMSSSYEGTLRRGDMLKQVFSEVYNVSEKSSCTYFDVLSEKTYLVAQKNGQVALVDDRAEGNRSQKTHTCHDYSIKTVNVHPVNRSIFVTAESRGPIRLWDLRKLQKQPIVDIRHHKRCVSSAYFSPVAGNSILAKSYDDTISIFDSTNLTKIKLKHLLRLCNQTRNIQNPKWISVLRVMWLPNSDEAFVFGSMNADCSIELFDKNMKVYCTVKHENLHSVSSLSIFHPGRPALAGANLYGKVVVFIPR